jgi:hypothetical protein
MDYDVGEAYTSDPNEAGTSWWLRHHPGGARMTCGRSPHHDFGFAENMLRFANHEPRSGACAKAHDYCSNVVSLMYC